MQEFFRFEPFGSGTSGDIRADDTFVGESAGGAGDHAFTAGYAGGIAHGGVEIESYAGRIAFAHTAEDEIVLDFVAAADAAVAEDARVVIDVNGERRIVFAAGDAAFGETRFFDAGVFGVGFEFAIAGIDLARARRWMIGH